MVIDGITYRIHVKKSADIVNQELQNTVGTADKGLTEGDIFESDGMKYQVISKTALTAKLIKGKNAARLKISTVTYDEKTYKIAEIGNAAFKGCKKLKKITLGADVASIGKNAFKGCNNKKLKKQLKRAGIKKDL